MGTSSRGTWRKQQAAFWRLAIEVRRRHASTSRKESHPQRVTISQMAVCTIFMGTLAESQRLGEEYSVQSGDLQRKHGFVATERLWYNW